MDTTTHVYISTRLCPTAGYGPKATITVTACQHRIGVQRACFSVTADINDNAGGRYGSAGGCLHTEILKYWPTLAPVIALHLSDYNGWPMYAEENGWYWLAGYYGGAGERYHGGNGQGQPKTPEECLQIFADHVRLPIAEVSELARSWRCDDDWAASRRWYAKWLHDQGGRFHEEADAATALLDRLIAEQAGRRAAKV